MLVKNKKEMRTNRVALYLIGFTFLHMVMMVWVVQVVVMFFLQFP